MERAHWKEWGLETRTSIRNTLGKKGRTGDGASEWAEGRHRGQAGHGKRGARLEGLLNEGFCLIRIFILFNCKFLIICISVCLCVGVCMGGMQVLIEA